MWNALWTYAAKPLKAGEGLMHQLTAAGGIRTTNIPGTVTVQFNFGEKPNLSDECTYILLITGTIYRRSNKLGFTGSSCVEPSSPGRCLLLDVDSLRGDLNGRASHSRQLWLDKCRPKGTREENHFRCRKSSDAEIHL